MNNSILLSVIIPVYNVEQYIHEAVDSVINQTYKNLEIILVDDGSPDNCPQICDDYAKKDSRVKVIHKKNAGLGMARNSGLDEATGDYITFIDSDDFIDLDTYADMIKIIEETDADCARFNIIRYSKGKDLLEKVRTNKYRLINTVADIRELSALIFENFTFPEEKRLRIDASVCTELFRADIIKDKGLRFPTERELLSEDYVFQFRILKYVKSIVLADNTYYHYRINQNSLSRNFDLSRLKRAESLCNVIEKEMDMRGYPSNLIEHLLGYYTNSLMVTFQAIMRRTVSDSRENKKMLNGIYSIPYTNKVINNFDVKRLDKSQKILFNFISTKFWTKPFWRINYFVFRLKNKIIHELKKI